MLAFTFYLHLHLHSCTYLHVRHCVLFFFKECQSTPVRVIMIFFVRSPPPIEIVVETDERFNEHRLNWVLTHHRGSFSLLALRYLLLSVFYVRFTRTIEHS